MDKRSVSPGAPATGAPYSPAIIAGDTVYVSGQIHMDPVSREVLRGDFEAEVRLCISNVDRILRVAGSGLDRCVKVTVFLADMDNFARLNAVYSEYFGDVKPARSCVQVARLPLDADVEIEAVALVR